MRIARLLVLAAMCSNVLCVSPFGRPLSPALRRLTLPPTVPVATGAPQTPPVTKAGQADHPSPLGLETGLTRARQLKLPRYTKRLGLGLFAAATVVYSFQGLLPRLEKLSPWFLVGGSSEPVGGEAGGFTSDGFSSSDPEAERKAAEAAEAERQAALEKAETDRKAAEAAKAEAERNAALEKAEAERMAAEAAKAEAERNAALEKAEAERKAADEKTKAKLEASRKNDSAERKATKEKAARRETVRKAAKAKRQAAKAKADKEAQDSWSVLLAVVLAFLFFQDQSSTPVKETPEPLMPVVHTTKILKTRQQPPQIIPPVEAAPVVPSARNRRPAVVQPEALPVQRVEPEALPVQRVEPEALPVQRVKPEALPVQRVEPEEVKQETHLEDAQMHAAAERLTSLKRKREGSEGQARRRRVGR